jgi:hypothetical protein
MNPRVLFFTFVCAIMGVAVGGEMRTWMAPDGRVIQGEFLKGDDESITVRKSDLTSVTIPVDKLIKADQETARKLVTEASANVEKKKGASQVETKAKEKGQGSITYKLSDGWEKWPEDRKKRIVAAMDEAVEFLNKNARFKKELIANNSPGTPTADASYSGWINWGGSINRRVALHEIAHTLGIGQHPNWQKNIQDGKWTGKHALAQLREFDGADAVLYADRQHFWPYGLNQDHESSPQSDLRFIKMLEAIRKDMGEN